jgi:hypothetical protein
MASEKIKQFNEILSSFLIQVSSLVGSTYHHQFQTIVKYNSLLPIEQFLIHALPVRDKILNRDESYFNNNKNHIDKIGNNENILNEILRLQNIYNQIDETSRSNVWDIFQAMLILGEEYINIKMKNKSVYKNYT